MLKKRIIPILLLQNGRCVKGRRFADYRDTGDPVTSAKVYDAQRVDELIFLDILASGEGRGPFLDIVTRTAEECFMPLTVGGGIASPDEIRDIFAAGADKISINTAAVEKPGFLKEAAEYFGSANIVISIDYRIHPDGSREVYTHGGKKAAGLDALEWAMAAADLGAGEIILTSIDREGTMSGYDIDFIRMVSGRVAVPVVAHGGAGTLAHLKEAVEAGGAQAAAAASIFHFTDQSPIKARLYMKNAGVNVRI